MSKPIDKEKELKEMHDSQASLVNALESIHTLLEESETKLDAARKNLAGSRIDNHKHHKPGHSKPSSKSLPKSSPTIKAPSRKLHEGELAVPILPEGELAVPILDDIVVPGIAQQPRPSFNKIETKTIARKPVEISDSRKQEFIDKLEAVQVEMDDYLNEMLVRCMASIELELKETLSQKLQDLRNIIEK